MRLHLVQQNSKVWFLGHRKEGISGLPPPYPFDSSEEGSNYNLHIGNCASDEHAHYHCSQQKACTQKPQNQEVQTHSLHCDQRDRNLECVPRKWDWMRSHYSQESDQYDENLARNPARKKLQKEADPPCWVSSSFLAHTLAASHSFL